MKNIWINIFVLVALLFLITGGMATVCPPTMLVDSNSIVFEYDPNLVNYKLMCVVRAQAGDEIVKWVSACDPDNDRMSFALQNEPNGMIMLPGLDPNEAQITWIAVEGTYYVDVFVIDHPPIAENYLEDRASMIFKVYPKNRPPIFTKCDGDLDANGRIDFNDFAIFAFVWQDCR